MTDTRRAIVKHLIDGGVTTFALRPLNGDEVQRQEVVELTPDEALWSLPCCDDGLTPIETETLFVVAADGLRVHNVISLDKATVIDLLNYGESVEVEKTTTTQLGYIWHKVAAKTAYVAECTEDQKTYYLRPR